MSPLRATRRQDNRPYGAQIFRHRRYSCKANEGAMTAETALRVGMAAGRVFRRGDHRHRVVIGKDTRLSGYMLEPALTAGFTSMGMDVFLFGPLPTTYRKNKRPFHPSPTALDRS
nr:unnamed protein product [Salmonella enterica subsp. enterica serovar Choleraesuis]